MRNVDDVMRLGELAFEKATEEAKALDQVFLQNIGQSGADLPRLAICHAMALFLIRSAKDGLLALDAQQALANGLPPIYREQIPLNEYLGDITHALRVAAELFEHMDNSPSAPKTNVHAGAA